MTVDTTCSLRTATHRFKDGDGLEKAKHQHNQTHIDMEHSRQEKDDVHRKTASDLDLETDIV